MSPLAGAPKIRHSSQVIWISRASGRPPLSGWRSTFLSGHVFCHQGRRGASVVSMVAACEGPLALPESPANGSTQFAPARAYRHCPAVVESAVVPSRYRSVREPHSPGEFLLSCVCFPHSMVFVPLPMNSSSSDAAPVTESLSVAYPALLSPCVPVSLPSVSGFCVCLSSHLCLPLRVPFFLSVGMVNFRTYCTALTLFGIADLAKTAYVEP
jgi:hypothetical protein